MSQHHARIKNSAEWKAARAACLARDEHMCVRCGSDEKLEADHITRLEDAPDLAFELDNLQTLCRPCHIDKEREYREQQLVRIDWINPAYPYLNKLIDKEKESEGAIL